MNAEGNKMLVLLIIWTIYIAVGAFLGSRKNRLVQGIVLATFLGPIGWGITLYLSKRPRDPVEPGALLPANPSAPQGLPASTVVPPPIPVPNHELQFRVAREGVDLGPMTVQQIRQLIDTGQLRKTDSFLDPQLNAWMALDLLPD